MPNEELWRAILCNEPLMSNRASFSTEDAQMIALLRKLRCIGIDPEELRNLCICLQSKRAAAEKVAMLRKTRYHLLNRLHEEQQALDALDRYVREIEISNQ